MSSQREFKAVFFDLDGTLVDIHGPLYIAARRALDDLGHAPPLTRETYHQALEQDDPFLGPPEDKRAEYSKLAFAYFLAEIDPPSGSNCCPTCMRRWPSSSGAAMQPPSSRAAPATRSGWSRNSRWSGWRLTSTR
jgi:hypothetical protein